jgi:hypothetical protein
MAIRAWCRYCIALTSLAVVLVCRLFLSHPRQSLTLTLRRLQASQALFATGTVDLLLELGTSALPGEVSEGS